MPRLKKVIPFIMLVITLLACAIPGASAPDADAISTTAAETIIAGLTQNVTVISTPTIAPSLTPTFTPTLIYLTSRFPSETPTLTVPPGTETLTPEVTATFTSMPVEMSVSRPTHCRVGPGKQYEIVGSLLVGMTVPVIGRDPTGQYWYIPNPYVFTEYCWVWGEYATFEGNQLLVPVVTPPATPTSTGTTTPTLEFKLKGSGLKSCSGAWWMNIEITSESVIPFESVKIEILDKDKNVTRVVAYNDFQALNGCSGLTINDKVTNGAAVLVSGPKFDYNIKGNVLRAYVTVCAEDDTKGVCTTREIPLNP